MNDTHKVEQIKKYVTENNLFTIPTRALTRLLMKDLPGIFTDFENTRAIIRYVRGSLGNKKSDLNIEFEQKFYGFMEADINDYSPFFIPESVTILGILNDIHFPYQHDENLNAAIKYLKLKQCNGILLNGDIIDCYKGSNFIKDPRQRDLIHEFEIVRQFIDELNAEFDCPIFYKLGNHEERIENLVLKQVPELIHFITFENCLSDAGKFDFSEYKLTVIKDKRIVKFTDNLSILHGHEYRGGFIPPVGISRWLFNKARGNASCGHFHKKDSFSSATINSHVIETNSIGCLCDLHPKYMPLNDWQSGFAIVKRLPNNNFRFSNILIENGVIY